MILGVLVSIGYFLFLQAVQFSNKFICTVMSIKVNTSCFFTCVLSLSVKEMDAEVNKVLRAGSSLHEVLSEGFGLSLTRKDLQTLSNLNWLNDEVSTHYPQCKICV